MAPALAANFTPTKKRLVIQSASRHAPLGLVGSTPSGLSSGAPDSGHSLNTAPIQNFLYSAKVDLIVKRRSVDLRTLNCQFNQFAKDGAQL